MALVVRYSTNNLPKILLFDIKSKNGKWKLLHEIQSLTKPLKLFDFSTDNCFLLYQQEDEEEVQFFDISEQLKEIVPQQIDPDLIEFRPDWSSTGLRITCKVR